ncbi:uncharacterized protein BDZ99DRAFT_380058 [Mytilinidion resinicola]|uniref:Uncharacterized protein n=1 Tax=Mytilinidion resinicola TaxID=574789 RepID=A0A6A6YZQ4_9PEZI|nr:uncharacterized protein BDZ99DRAFT_380058 [Mytilinidion resinicola]KAF2814240.1 hypothetical protein BDZ99DRAFT_380058 [Mytilinidion resinicola]
MTGIEFASQPQSVASENAAAESPLILPPVSPKRLSVSAYSGSDCDPEVQFNLRTSGVALHDELQFELTEERKLREKAESELCEMKSKAKDIRQRWKLAARELNKIQRQGQGSGFYQVTDNYLIDLITRLRYNIRNIAIQYFSEPLDRVRRPLENSVLYATLESTTPGSDKFFEYLLSSAQRPKIIQAFFWNVLVDDVFNRFRWAGRGSRSMWKLYSILKPDTEGKTYLNPEAEKRFHVWRANTVGLLLDSMTRELSHEVDEEVQQWKAKTIDQVEAVIYWYRSPDSEGYQEEFLRILDEALELDKEISRQVTGVRFLFHEQESNPVFDPSMMELEKDEKVSGGKQKVSLVTSPAVVKRGKSTGESFNEATLLLRMEVTCEDPRR